MKHKKLAVAFGAASLVALVAAPAMAAGPYNVAVGTFTSGNHNYTATPKAGITFVVHHGASVVNMGCSTASAAGTIKAGADADGLGIGEINSTTWGNSPSAPCLGPGGLAMNVTQVGQWHINATGAATSGISGTVAGNVSNINATVSSKTPGVCTFTVSGRANATVAEAVTKPGPPVTTAQELIVNETAGNLVVSGVSGCLGLIANGDTADFQATYNFASPDGLINIKP